ncbi:transcription termination factor 1 [Tenrec ecaudatus]|uniref:transcription termination factor 1 n=1 Tax=Tenrec ecaudatus TaxID=94439 RepID=UPI003F597E64
MEGSSSQYEIHTPVIGKKKKKKKHSVDMERHPKSSSKTFQESCPASKQFPVTKRGKKRKTTQHCMSSLDKSQMGDEPEEAAVTSKKHKKRRKRALESDKETGVAYVLVSKENIEAASVDFSTDGNGISVHLSRGQKPAQEPAAEELPLVPQACANESEQLHENGRRKKHRKRQRVETSCDSQETPCVSIAQYQSEPQQQESLLSADPHEETPEHLGMTGQKKKKKKKKKNSNNSGLEALPEHLENMNPEGSQVMGEIGSGQVSDALEEVTGCCGTKRKSKKRKRRPSVENAVGAGVDSSMRSSSEDTRFHLQRGDSVAGEGTLIEDCVKPRTKKKKTQASSEQNLLEEGHRVESTNEEEGDLESARHPESYLSEDSRNSDDSDVDLGSAMKQLQEFIPDIKERAATSIKRMYRDDLDRFKEFKAQGVPIKFGKFSSKENRQLKENVQEFLSLTGIETADKLLHTDRYPEERAMITDLKRKYGFRVHIGKDIARPWKLVYYRAKKMFDINNYKGRYSKGDTEKLMLYHSLHGNDWKKIGEMVARSSLSVALKYSQIGSPVNRGSWSKAEIKRLIKAVEQVILNKMSLQELNDMDSSLQENPEDRLSIVREKLYKGISWVEVEAKVETRNWMQCKSKWTDVLTKRMTQGRDVYRGVNALQAKINLIERLYDINVEESNEIDWEDLASAIGDVPPSYVRSKFHKLKTTCVPSWQNKTFPEIVDYLHETSLPLFKERLGKKLEKEGAELPAPAAPKQVFLFRDIFYSEDESEGEDVNEKS